MAKYWSGDNVESAEVFLYGRVCYEGMAAYWPAAEADPEATEDWIEHARQINNKPKIVFSKSLQEANWKNTRIVGDNIAEEIAKLKQEPGKDLVLFGGADIVNTFMQLGLVDEYRLLITPIVLAGGTPLFKNGLDRFNLKLLDTKTMDTGAVIVRYEPA